ncbi:unnamed protein product [Prorocentrum cordatum]|uniref:thiamine phosphate synthase n=1 Tax=Prorocentrum cordatum TaxID=2364126 RepID=A0ABN9TPL9_9DINO|nr:unnamed protein product [Polarella glacialis]
MLAARAVFRVRAPQAGRRAKVPERLVRWPAPAGRRFCAAGAGARARRNDYELYLVTDDTYLDGLFYEKIAAAVEGGVTCVQLRLKHASTATLVEWGHRVRELTRQAGVPLIIDDRLDVALACDADGLHVGGEDLPWRTARRLLGPSRILGCSTYGRPDLVREALHPEVRADYLGSGAIFATSTKHSSVPKGIEHLPGLRRLVAEEAAGRTVPIVAIGGVGLAASGECVAAGADGVAAVSALLGHASAEGTRQAAAAMLAAVRGAVRPVA